MYTTDTTTKSLTLNVIYEVLYIHTITQFHLFSIPMVSNVTPKNKYITQICFLQKQQQTKFIGIQKTDCV